MWQLQGVYIENLESDMGLPEYPYGVVRLAVVFDHGARLASFM